VFDDPWIFGDKLQEGMPPKKKQTRKKERHDRWKNLKDYGIIPCCKLAQDIEANMLCKCCVSDMLKAKKPVDIGINELGVKVTSMTSSFACILTIECCKNDTHISLNHPEDSPPAL